MTAGPRRPDRPAGNPGRPGTRAPVPAAGDSTPPAQGTGGGGILLLALALGLLAALPYLHGVTNGFIRLDDTGYVTQNAFVRPGLTASGARWAFTTFHMGNWHPLTWLSHMADVSLFGLQPWGHHLVNILLHGLNTGLLFVALSRLTGALWPSAFVAALFGVHPLHVESVAWVAERKDLLAAFFFLLLLLAYERWARRGKAIDYLSVLLLLALGLMAKPMLVTVPFVLLLLDVWPLGRTPLGPPAAGRKGTPRPWGGLLLEKAPLFALSLASSLITYAAQRAGGSFLDLGWLPPGMRAANAVVSYVVYLRGAVWPSELAVLYPYPVEGHPPWRVLGSLLLLALLSCGVLSRFRRAPFLAVGWLWFLGMLFPVIGLVQVGNQALADRYTYLPLVGLFLAAAWGATRAIPDRPSRPALLGTCAFAVVVLLSAATWRQVSWWKDTETLFRRTLSVTAGNPLIEYNLGNTLMDRGELDEAETHFRQACRTRPGYAAAQSNLGTVLWRQGRLDEAVVQYREALRSQKAQPVIHENLAVLLTRLGRHEEAKPHLDEARRLRGFK